MSGSRTASEGDIFRMRVLPSSPATRVLLRAHLEAHDHLAVASDLPDGSIEVSGPATQTLEIRAVVAELARALGLLAVPSG